MNYQQQVVSLEMNEQELDKVSGGLTLGGRLERSAEILADSRVGTPKATTVNPAPRISNVPAYKIY